MWIFLCSPPRRDIRRYKFCCIVSRVFGKLLNWYKKQKPRFLIRWVCHPLLLIFHAENVEFILPQAAEQGLLENLEVLDVVLLPLFSSKLVHRGRINVNQLSFCHGYITTEFRKNKVKMRKYKVDLRNCNFNLRTSGCVKSHSPLWCISLAGWVHQSPVLQLWSPCIWVVSYKLPYYIAMHCVDAWPLTRRMPDWDLSCLFSRGLWADKQLFTDWQLMCSIGQ